jgi:uncharacterized protein
MKTGDMPSPPASLFGRSRQWQQLTDFVASPLPQALLGLVYGRRRQGKTTLLQHLCTAYGGFYWQAKETEPSENLVSLSEAYTAWVGSHAPIRFGSWDEAVTALLNKRDAPTPIVLDEIGRVTARVPALPSMFQRQLDSHGAKENWSRLILCGSAFGQMRRLLDSSAPLRGRATLELVVHPFDYRTAASFWGLNSNPSAAFELFAYIGGTPAYPTFAGGDTPKSGNVNRWVCRRLLDPSSALFREGRIIVAEDQELNDQQMYWGLLGTVASGKVRWKDIDEALGAKRGSLAHALKIVMDAGWVLRRDDPLRKNRSTYELREPIIRFHRLVIEPNEHRLSLGLDPARVWNDAEPFVASLILGVELERLTYEWCMVFAASETFGGVASAAGPTALIRQVSDRQGETIRDLDLAVVENTPRGGQRLLALGEVKALTTKVGVRLLERLDTAVDAIRIHPPVGVDTTGEIKRVIVSRSGFTNELRRIGLSRSDVEMVDLDRLYNGE